MRQGFLPSRPHIEQSACGLRWARPHVSSDLERPPDHRQGVGCGRDGWSARGRVWPLGSIREARNLHPMGSVATFAQEHVSGVLEPGDKNNMPRSRSRSGRPSVRFDPNVLEDQRTDRFHRIADRATAALGGDLPGDSHAPRPRRDLRKCLQDVTAAARLLTEALRDTLVFVGELKAEIRRLRARVADLEAAREPSA